MLTTADNPKSRRSFRSPSFRPTYIWASRDAILTVVRASFRSLRARCHGTAFMSSDCSTDRGIADKRRCRKHARSNVGSATCHQLSK